MNYWLMIAVVLLALAGVVAAIALDRDDGPAAR